MTAASPSLSRRRRTPFRTGAVAALCWTVFTLVLGGLTLWLVLRNTFVWEGGQQLIFTESGSGAVLVASVNVTASAQRYSWQSRETLPVTQVSLRLQPASGEPLIYEAQAKQIGVTADALQTALAAQTPQADPALLAAEVAVFLDAAHWLSESDHWTPALIADRQHRWAHRPALHSAGWSKAIYDGTGPLKAPAPLSKAAPPLLASLMTLWLLGLLLIRCRAGHHPASFDHRT